MGISILFSHKKHVVVHDFTEFSINAKHFQLFDGKSEKPRLICGPAKNLRGPAQVRGPAVENHCSRKFPIGFRGISRLGSSFIFLQWFKHVHIYIQVTSVHRWNKQGINKNSLDLFSRLFEESPAWFCFHLLAMIRACTYHSAKFVKPQQWPTPSESIAIYCVRKLVSCITHLQSCANVDIWNKKKKLRTVA